MKRGIAIVVFLIYVLSGLSAVAGNYCFKNIGIQEGLSQATVYAIVQDRKGFLWFGTKWGLCRYDGMTIRTFKRDAHNGHSLGNNFIKCLYEDGEGRIWVGTDAGLYVYYPEREIFVPFREINGGKADIEHTVTAIEGDKRGRIWIAVESEGLYCYDEASDDLRQHKPDHFKSNVQSFVMDNGGRIWIGFYGSGLYYSDDDLETVNPYVTKTGGEEIFKDDVIMKIVPGPYNCLYISSIRSGVHMLNLTTGNLTGLLSSDESGEPIFCRDILVRTNEELWIGAESGIYIYNLRTRHFRHLSSSEGNDLHSLSDNAIYALYEDRDGGLWVGTYFGGVDFLPKSTEYFEKYYPSQSGGGLHGKRVRKFCKDRNGMIWIGTEDGGLNMFNPQTKKFTFVESSDGFRNIQGLCAVGDELWVGTFSKGLKIIDINSMRIVRTYQQGQTPQSLNDNSVFAICHTTTGDVYVGTMFGLLRYDRHSDGFERIGELDGKFIYDIKEDSDGNIWLATYVNGVYCYDVNGHRWKNYLHNDPDEGSLSSNKVLSISEAQGRVWVTTEGGGCSLFDNVTDKFTNYNTANGLPADVVYQIVEDCKGQLWLTTNVGLMKFQPETMQVKSYNTSNGLLSDQFNYQSSFCDDNGDIYLGCLDGFVRFNPESFVEERSRAGLAIFDFMLFNKEVYPYDEGSPLEKSITYSEDITLGSGQNSFSLRIGSLGFQGMKKDRLMYKLEGFDDEWIELGESPIVTYSNLGHGNYLFKMKLVDPDSAEGATLGDEYKLKIKILPPFYLSTWAYMAYILIIIIGTVLLFRYMKHKTEKARAHQLEKFERQKETELYKAKIDFFTNVAHEIRTPLTLIKGPLDNILQSKQLDSETHEDLSIMSRNTERLLNLTNQLLDFRKVESRGYKLNFTKCNLTDIVKDTYTRFQTVARQRGLDFTLEIPQESVDAHVNREAFTKILSNLLNNGIKYAESYLHVRLKVDYEGRQFQVITENDGLEIPPEVREPIFQPFVRFSEEDECRVATGTGIGLALSRSLAELHRGTLVMAAEAANNTFVLTMPLDQADATVLESGQREHPLTDQAGSVQNQIKDHSGKERKHTVLVVEDNDEMREFIKRQLSRHYSVLTAANGKEALGILDNNFVNLVVSDVVMPEMDGFELCRTIKSNIDYSHIPVVLLTAKTNIQSKIEGMELGADSYIEKPFSSEYLIAVVSNLINSREKLRKDFANSHYAEVSTMALTKADEEFIKKLENVIQTNLSNQDFNIDDMAESFNMSRSSFYRKVQGVLDLTPKEYLRVERLKRAAQLLREKEYRINEICYMVGFNTSSYFTKCFLKQYGVLPKDFS